jgi:hypothetical protein
MFNFCTYFDHRYLLQGLALYRSLERQSSSFHLWVLCLDAPCFETLSRLNLAHATLLPLTAFESHDPELLKTKRDRSLVEYYFTCTPSLPLYVFARFPQVDMVTYLDADLYFFADPAPIYKEMASGSIAIIPHRFPKHLRHLSKHGLYNVGWLTFSREAEAFRCLQRWREQCIEWCLRKTENDRYADQKYLDEWPSLYKSLVVLRHKGANLAPWNLANYEIRWHDGRVWVDDQPLIFYHFHGLHPLRIWFYDSQLDHYQLKPSLRVMRRIYLPYIQSLKQESRLISYRIQNTGRMEGKNVHELRVSNFQPVSVTGVSASLRRVLRLCKGLLTRKYFLAARKCIL